ncbi:hypothetical protein ASF00_17710 [Sphingomonas sp. Leaf34]|nr:hypothetical protein ASF00_17710 [Sphingomonas sp. Leaf34]
MSVVLGVAPVIGNSAATAQTTSPGRPAPVLGGTPVELMVTKEVDSRSAKEGDRFKLRVNAPVMTNGVVAVPVGATAWGEVTYVNGTGAAGNKGRLAAKLLYIDLPSGPLPISGSQGTEGKANTAGVVIGVFSFGLLGLLMKGGNAHFKAGDILTGYISPPAQAAATQ